MAIDEIGFDSVKFSGVWERVTADKDNRPAALSAPPPARPSEYNSVQMTQSDELIQLSRLMEDTALCIAYCRKLACRCTGAKTLEYILCEEKRALKKLRARYYIMTGGAYCPQADAPLFCTASEGLRDLYILIEKMEKEYTYAAKTVPPEYADIYAGLALIKQREKEQIFCLIDNMFR